MPRHHLGAAMHPCTPETARRAYSTAGTRAHVLSLPGHAAAACLLRRRVPDAHWAAMCFVTRCVTVMPPAVCALRRRLRVMPPFTRYAAVCPLRCHLPVTPPFTRYAAIRPLCRRSPRYVAVRPVTPSCARYAAVCPLRRRLLVTPLCPLYANMPASHDAWLRSNDAGAMRRRGMCGRCGAASAPP